jgi:hypothetical protein
MNTAPTALDNINRVLSHYGLRDNFVATDVRPDRVYGWPTDDAILRHMVLNRWPADPGCVAQEEHGTAISYREPGGVHPALQACVHIAPPGYPWPYYLELDLDFHAPNIKHPFATIQHGGEVLHNLITHSTTDQAEIARLLDRRFA